MDTQIAQKRLPIKSLFDYEPGMNQMCFNFFSKRFNMFRIINTDSFQAANSYAFLEHVLRPTSFLFEKENARSRIPPSLRCTLFAKSSNFFNSDLLQSHVKEEDLMQVSGVLAITKYYKIRNGKLIYKQTVPETHGALPISYILKVNNKHAMLYTHIMTFVDECGMHSRYKSISNILLKRARTNLYGSSTHKNKRKILDFKKESAQELSPCSSQDGDCHDRILKGSSVFSLADFATTSPCCDENPEALFEDRNKDSCIGREQMPFRLLNYNKPTNRSSRKCCSDFCVIF